MNGVKHPTAEDQAACQAVLEELDSLAGCRQAKEQLRRLAMESLFFGRFSGHLAFVGDPGTGKTHVARLMGRLLHACGALPTDRVVVCIKRDLISPYIGATVEKTRAICESALGGVLVIDDAWQLVDAGENTCGKFRSPFEQEALSAIIAFAEEHCGELCIIFTGYREQMRKLFEVSSWFFGRVSRVIHFEPFTAEELTAVFMQTAETDGIALADGVKKAAMKAFTNILAKQEKEFGNARAAIDFYWRCKGNLVQRILELHKAGELELVENQKYIMTVGDVPGGQEGLL